MNIYRYMLRFNVVPYDLLLSVILSIRYTVRLDQTKLIHIIDSDLLDFPYRTLENTYMLDL